MSLFYNEWTSPLGRLHIVATSTKLKVVAFDSNWPKLKRGLGTQLSIQSNPVIEKTVLELAEYFRGERKRFSVPIELDGTDFQMKAWALLTKIPFGKTLSYGEQAAKIQRANAARAVGAANGRNPVSILIPCHRVVNQKGGLSGYAGGLDNKRALLALERELGQ